MNLGGHRAQRRGALVKALGLLLAAVVGLAPQAVQARMPREPAQHHDAALLSAQSDAAERQLSRHPESPPVVLVAAALDGNSKAFVGDVRLAGSQLATLAPRLGLLQLGNHGAPRDWPAASGRNVAQAVERAAALLRAQPAESHPLAIVLLTSHGNEGHIVLEERRSRRLHFVPAAQLQRWLQPLQGLPTLVIVSACHSGSLLPALQAPKRIVMAAARHDRSSFGCETESRNTYFVDELFHALQPGLSIEQWFAATTKAVAERERSMALSPPSEPQIELGPQAAGLAGRPLGELLGGLR